MAATKELSQDVVMTSRALEVLTCFQDEFDDLVAKMAEDHARDRVANDPAASAVIEVGIDDVKAAAEQLLALVQGLVAKRTLRPEVQSLIQDMNNCLNCKTN